MYFIIIFDILTADRNALFAELYCQPEGDREPLFGAGFDHPLQALLEGVGGKAAGRQV